MSKFSKNIVKNYKEQKEWRRAHIPWLWKAENSIISKIADTEKFFVFVVIVFLSIPLLVFISECFEAFNFQLLIGIAGVLAWAIIAIPKTRHLLILRPDPAKSIDRIIVFLSMGSILFVIGAIGIQDPSPSYSSSSFEFDLEKERKEKEEEKKNVDRYNSNRAQILRSFEENISEKKYMFVMNETEKYLSLFPNDYELKQINHRARMEQAELNLISSRAYEKAAEKERIKEEEKQRVGSTCEQDCSINKYQYNESCYQACMKAHAY